MRERISKAVDDIFMEYESTPELQDFKEEIAMNLSEHVRDMMKKGVTEEQALKKALEELGDITEAADEVSRQKRKEIIGQAYARPVPLDKTHVVGYPVTGLILAFGAVVCAISAFRTGSVMKAIASLMLFAVLAVGGFVYLGLTQETRAHYAMSKKRSLFYVFASALLTLGAFLSGIVLFYDITTYELANSNLAELKIRLIEANPIASLGTLIPFVLPAAALLAFLILTEKSRKKPWVLRMEEESQMIYGESFGLLSGALWICAIALFVLLGMLVSWRISWVVFLFAVAAQCLVQYFTAKKHGK